MLLCQLQQGETRTHGQRRLALILLRLLGSVAKQFPDRTAEGGELFCGKDLIGVQNLLKKHQALQAEITGHEPRIKAVTQKGETMVEEGRAGHFAGEEVKTKLWELHGRWDTLKAKASQRRQDLEDSLQAQQYFADANEAESWMREKEPIVRSPD
nr:spectrin alpha chain, non-erythrocytic 1-like [Nothobranchius furzeri]